MFYVAFLAVMVLGAIVQWNLNRKFRKYSKVAAPLTGAQVAETMLKQNGIYDVSVTSIKGTLTDHYDPAKKTINLSGDVYSQRSIAAAAVAAHETGHAIQHAKGYAPLKLRSAMVPVVSFANSAVSIVLVIGVILVEVLPSILWIGIGLFALTTLFSFVTLPVEIDASARAIAWLKDSRLASDETLPKAVDALKWAAYTYVIAALGSLITLLYYIGIARSK